MFAIKSMALSQSLLRVLSCQGGVHSMGWGWKRWEGQANLCKKHDQTASSKGCCPPESDSSQHLSPSVLDLMMKVRRLSGIQAINIKCLL